MSNSNYENVQSQKNYRSNFKGKYGGGRDSGGFRIRLSDNEMNSVKSIQENFQLKSTVAVLGFSVRTLSEMIKDESLKEIIKKYAQNSKNNSTPNQNNSPNSRAQSSPPDPFARPVKNEKIDTNNEQNDNLDEK